MLEAWLPRNTTPAAEPPTAGRPLDNWERHLRMYYWLCEHIEVNVRHPLCAMART
jgi:hypothetical protein